MSALVSAVPARALGRIRRSLDKNLSLKPIAMNDKEL